ncbi:MAG: NADP-dependent isocitrate dehydrogenase [Phycisphaerae bacterium]|nr:NADP-dependent isocitrate dehydrogenase [Phycisphaerae bacterium]
MAGERRTITLMAGDGIGPECMAAVRRVIEAAGTKITWEECDAGAEVFKRGVASGVPQETLDSIARNKVALKGPLETPVGFGEKSANVTLRKLFELYGNVRPTREIPGVQGVFAGRRIDLVVVRENVEDLYAGIEHMQTPGVAQCLKLISRKGCEKIVRLAFEIARAEGRKKVHCSTKANIMKLTEGLLKRTFEEIAPEYPEIATEHIIIDNCAHQLVRYPEQFEVIVTTNMNGDIISDLTSGLTGGLGLAPSSNIGNDVAMFEAVHGSAPNIAGKNLANPTALLLSAVMMLRHIGEFTAADKIENAICLTIEEGHTLTVDLAHSQELSSTTTQFTDEIIRNLGRRSSHVAARAYRPIKLPYVDPRPDLVHAKTRRVVGADVFVETADDPHTLGAAMEQASADSSLKLKMVSNRGTKLYPGPKQMTDCVDHYRCRFVMRDAARDLSDADLLNLLQRVGAKRVWNHVEKLYEFDGKSGFTKAQGED